MLSLERCREILGSECKLSDAELELLRDQLYGLADVAIDAFVEQRKRRKDARAEIEERAAIHEIDGGLDRNQAERTSFSDLWRRKHQRD